ncbi:MAG: electron transport complex subunit RsxC [Gallionellales bacterium GWA2_60_142]|jgi:electron transport complex protein RnfC|nr:MAG: electron transport complex subunit RsxC [Gallionellales bacterium GWA2_60_142]HCI13119.1 electron transport complex subunit RsxC [Gallionellaceae bacterium]
MRTLFKFHGGVHPPGNKAQSTQQPTAVAPIPAKLVIPFRQHAGEAAKPVVQVGDHVLKGQLIGEPAGFISSAIHAPTSGTITAIDIQPVAHPSGLPDLCATLIPDGRDEWVERKPTDYRTLPADELRHLLRMSGIVGLGGAVFPSDVKLRPLRDHPNKDIGTLILNGAECEPWITCDDMLMRERAAEIVQGAEMLRSMLGSREVLIGIEDNKPEAIAAMRLAVADSGLPFEVVAVPTIYPGGSAKQLIRVLTGLEVPSGKLPTDIGVQCFNVATVYSAWRAVAHGEPLISRVVTVTGNVARPRNYEALIGTPLTDLIALGEPLPDTDGYIMGGPMMGTPLPSTSVPLVKAGNCIIAGSKKLFPPPPPALPCIRCTRCAQACPADLQPMDLYWFSQSKNFGQAQAFSLFDCIECGACSYVCPSHIPLVQYFRFSKSEIRMREQEKQAADRARERHEYREFRIEREKQEKAERLAAKEKAAAAAKPVEPPVVATNPDAAPENTAQMKIQAAIEHAKEQAAAIKPKNTENLSAEQLAEIAEIEARRARIRETAKSDVEPPKE